MCENIPCITACENGSLSPPENGGFPPIGEAKIDTRVCLAWNGSVCWTCYDTCPLKGSALKLIAGRPAVDTAACSGCGRCEFACPAGNRGIVVNPM
jgi:ferredoxin-type protein NapG